MTSISVQVPEDETGALIDLSTNLGFVDTPDGVIAQPFDGMVMVQILIPASMAAISVLRKWIDARQKSRSSYRIFFRGVDISGYSASEAERLLLRLADISGNSNDQEK